MVFTEELHASRQTRLDRAAIRKPVSRGSLKRAKPTSGGPPNPKKLSDRLEKIRRHLVASGPTTITKRAATECLSSRHFRSSTAPT